MPNIMMDLLGSMLPAPEYATKEYVQARIAEAMAYAGSGGITPGDEGKVVSGGVLVSQTAHPQITTNGTYDTTLNNSVEISVSGGNTLPDSYQEVEWISADDFGHAGHAGAYFDTGIIPDIHTGIVIKFAAVGTQLQFNFFGGREAQSGSNYAILIASFSSAQKIGFMRWGSSVQAIPYDTVFHTYELTETTSIIDDVSYTLSAPVTTQYGQRSFHVFAPTTAGGYDGGSPIKIASLKLYDSGALVRDYVPCYRIADNVIGMYDLVTESFKTNEGTGNFTKGDDVVDANRALSILLGGDR